MIVQSVDAYKEFLPAEYWISRDSVDPYISKIGRNANLKRASEKKYNYLQTKGLVKAKPITEAELYIDLLLDLNASAHKDDSMWMTLVDTDDETVEEFLQRTGSSQMFGLDDSGQENNVNSDVSAILSMKKVDVPRLSAGVNEIITDRKKHEASRVQDNIKHDQMVDETRFELGNRNTVLCYVASCKLCIIRGSQIMNAHSHLV